MHRRLQAMAAGALLMTGAAMVGAPLAVSAQTPPAPAHQVNGAAGLVAAIVGLNGTNIQVLNVGNSLNNLTALNNVLNNSPVLSNNHIVVSNILTGITVQDIANNSLNNILQNTNVNVGVLASVLSAYPPGTVFTLITTTTGGVLALI